MSMMPAAAPIARRGALIVCVLASACTHNSTAPSDQGPLRLTGAVNRALISSGERADVTFTLHNPGPSATMLPFTSSCHILPYIVNTSTGQIVHPSGGGWACLAVLTQLTVPPGDAVKENVQVVAAASAAYPAVALPPGTYSAYATVDSTAFQGRSDPIAFTVR